MSTSLKVNEMPNSPSNKNLLLIGASRGLGCALAAEYLKRGWHVVATVCGASKTRLHDILENSSGRLEIETVDINFPDQVAAPHTRLAARRFQLLFVNAGVKNDDRETIADVSTDEFVRVMVTNRLNPMRVVESFQDLVVSTGTIGLMSSGQGSVANNESGKYEVYRASKAALRHTNAQFRRPPCRRPTYLVAYGAGLGAYRHGWPRCTIKYRRKHSTSGRHDRRVTGNGGLQYLDYLGRKVPW
jgi:NADP-dependent 3-hydroxy acid dehydrogenase YdfG